MCRMAVQSLSLFILKRIGSSGWCTQNLSRQKLIEWPLQNDCVQKCWHAYVYSPQCSTRPLLIQQQTFALPIKQFGAQEGQKEHTCRGKTKVAKMIGKHSNIYAPHDRNTTPAMFFVLRRCCVDVGFLIRKRFFFFKITTSTHLRSLRTCTKVYDLLYFLKVWAVDASPCKQACIWSVQGLQAGAVCWRGNRFTKQLRANTHLSLPRSLVFEPEPQAERYTTTKSIKNTILY